MKNHNEKENLKSNEKIFFFYYAYFDANAATLVPLVSRGHTATAAWGNPPGLPCQSPAGPSWAAIGHNAVAARRKTHHTPRSRPRKKEGRLRWLQAPNWRSLRWRPCRISSLSKIPHKKIPQKISTQKNSTKKFHKKIPHKKFHKKIPQKNSTDSKIMDEKDRLIRRRRSGGRNRK